VSGSRSAGAFWWPWIRAVALPAGLSLLVLRAVLGPGYLLQVDAVFGPRLQPLTWSFSSPLQVAVAVLHAVAGSATGAICFLAALFLAGLGPMVLARGRPWWVQCLAGLIGALNPFVYARLVEGQWSIVAATGLLFLWVAAWERLAAAAGRGAVAGLASCTVAVAAASPNMLGPLALLALLGLLWQRPWRDPAVRRRLLTGLGVSAAALLYGVLAFFVSQGGDSFTAVRGFGRADFVAFRSAPDPHWGLLPALAGLYGEWAERVGRFPVATAAAPWWPVASGLLVLATLFGTWRARQRSWLLVAGVLGLLLSALTATGWGLDLAVAAAHRLPLLAAWREPQKWLALWLLAVATLAPESLVPRGLRRGTAAGWGVAAAAAAMAAAVLLPGGVTELQRTSSIVRPVAYPPDWMAAEEAVALEVAPRERVAVLPWHLYAELPFTGRLAANPAPVLFREPLLASSDPEIPGSPPQPSPAGIGALSLADSDPVPCALADALRAAGVHWAVVEDVGGGEQNRRRLVACGFHPVSGTSGQTTLLQG